MNTQPHPDRTIPEALHDIDYLIRLNQRHERLFGRLSGTVRLIEIVAGSLGIAVALDAAANSFALAGGLFALIGFITFAFDPAKRCAQHTIARREYVALRARHAALSIDQIDSERFLIEDPTYIEALRLPSFNDVMRSHGLDSAIEPLTRWQRTLNAIA